MNTIRKSLAAFALVALPVLPLQAAVIDHADVAGLKTFQDTNTGRVWLDLDNFYNMNTTDMVAAANAAGFTFAVRSDVEGLLNTLPLNGGEWASYQAVMGDAPNRELIWGSYDDGGDATVAGWAYAFDGDSIWTFQDGSVGMNVISNQGTEFVDMNIWAYQTGQAQVPEPGLLALVGIGLAGMGVARRRRT